MVAHITANSLSLWFRPAVVNSSIDTTTLMLGTHTLSLCPTCKLRFVYERLLFAAVEHDLSVESYTVELCHSN
jgi:hypothetical protein